MGCGRCARSEGSPESESDGSERISRPVRQAETGAVGCRQVEAEDANGEGESQPDLERVVHVVSCALCPSNSNEKKTLF